MRARQRQLPHPSFPPAVHCSLIDRRRPRSTYESSIRTIRRTRRIRPPWPSLSSGRSGRSIGRRLAGADRRRLGSRSIHTSQLVWPTTHGIAGPSHLAIRQSTGHVSTLQTYRSVNDPFLGPRATGLATHALAVVRTSLAIEAARATEQTRRPAARHAHAWELATGSVSTALASGRRRRRARPRPEPKRKSARAGETGREISGASFCFGPV
jgi:hypothetical protein